MKFGATLKALAASDANARGAFDYKGLKKRIKRLRLEEDAAARQAALREMHGVIVAEVSRVNQELSHRRANLDWVGGGVLPLESSPGAQALREFAELNATAVRKGVKKLDKALTDAERLEVLGWRDSRPVRIADPMDVSRSGATVGGLVRVLQDSEARARMPLEELGRGAFATVHALAPGVKLHHSGSWAGGVDAEKGGAGPSVAIKHGHWSSQAAFEREVALQRAAAGAGVAPCVYFSRWLGGPLGKNGVVGMARLTSPSFFRWLCWETRELASAKARGGWLIHPSLSKQPIVCTWRAEASPRPLSDPFPPASSQHDFSVLTYNVCWECVSGPASDPSLVAPSPRLGAPPLGGAAVAQHRAPRRARDEPDVSRAGCQPLRASHRRLLRRRGGRRPGGQGAHPHCDPQGAERGTRAALCHRLWAREDGPRAARLGDRVLGERPTAARPGAAPADPDARAPNRGAGEGQGGRLSWALHRCLLPELNEHAHVTVSLAASVCLVETHTSAAALSGSAHLRRAKAVEIYIWTSTWRLACVGPRTHTSSALSPPPRAPAVGQRGKVLVYRAVGSDLAIGA